MQTSTNNIKRKEEKNQNSTNNKEIYVQKTEYEAASPVTS